MRLVVPEDPPRSDSGRAQDRSWAELVDSLLTTPRTFDEQWSIFRDLYARRAVTDGPPITWMPSLEGMHASNIGTLQALTGRTSYATLYQWSVQEQSAFIDTMVERLGIAFASPPRMMLDQGTDARHARWFPDARLSIVDSCFRADGERTAIIFAREGDPAPTRVSYRELAGHVRTVAAGLERHGLAGKGIALYMPMSIECVVAYLAVIHTGGFVVSVADSFSPPELRRRVELGMASAVITVDRYRRGGKVVALYDKVVAADAPRAVLVGALGEPPSVRRRVALHPVCSLHKLGLVEHMREIAESVAGSASTPLSAGCCGFA